MAICPSCNTEKGCTCSWSTTKAGIKVCAQCASFANSQPENNNLGGSPGSSSGNTPIINDSLKITSPPIKTAITPEITGVKYNNFQS